MKKILIIELDEWADIASVCLSAGYIPIFIRTINYKEWLPDVDNHNFNHEVYQFDTLSFWDIIKFSIDKDIDVILPISLLETESLRDALTLDFVNNLNLPFRIIANMPYAVELTYDKWLTKQYMLSKNISTVNGCILNHHELLENTPYEFPIIVKQRKGFTGQGMRIIKDRSSLDIYLKKYISSDILVEPFLYGSEISLEVIVWKNEIIFQPLVYKGETRLNLFEHPAYRPRIAPWRKNSRIEKEIHTITKEIVNSLNLKGAIEFEFIISNEIPLLLEINPRISGVSKLCAAAGGVNTYKTLAHIAINNSLPINHFHGNFKYAIQLPLTVVDDKELLSELQNDINFCYLKEILWMPLLSIKCNIILSYNSLNDLNSGLKKYKKYTSIEYYKEALASINYSFNS